MEQIEENKSYPTQFKSTLIKFHKVTILFLCRLHDCVLCLLILLTFILPNPVLDKERMFQFSIG